MERLSVIDQQQTGTEQREQHTHQAAVQEQAASDTSGMRQQSAPRSSKPVAAGIISASEHPAASGSSRQAVQRTQHTTPATGENPATANTSAETATTAISDSLALSGTDSLARPQADSLAQVDSLGTIAEIPDNPYRQAEAAEVFGITSQRASEKPLPPVSAQSFTDNPVFQGMVLVLAMTYAVLLFRNLSDIGLLLLRTWRKSPHNDRLAEEQRSSGFSRFLNIALCIGLLFTGVMVVKFSDVLASGHLRDMPRHGIVVGMTLLTTLVFFAVTGFQFLLLRLAGAVTLSQPLVSRLVYLKRTFFALTVILTSPALLLFALCPPGAGEVWCYASAALLTITSLLYLKETLQLFISKKLSILHWFLYLCTVEILPFSLLVFLAVR